MQLKQPKYIVIAAAALVLFLALTLITSVTSKRDVKAANVVVAIEEAAFALRCVRDARTSSSRNKNRDRGIRLTDATYLLGTEKRAKTFSLGVSDFNNDGLDDILIGSHTGSPFLYRNTATGFVNDSRRLFKVPAHADKHGYTIVDIDDNGFLDIAIAGGGADGIGNGSPNIFMRNTTAERGMLSFDHSPVTKNISSRATRARALIPVPSNTGERVDLYLTALSRDGFPNQLLENKTTNAKFKFAPTRGQPPSMSIMDHGRGVVTDFDANGEADYLVIDGGTARIIWGPKTNKATTVLANHAYSTQVADLNNDGLLDIYLGRSSTPSRSDHLSHNTRQIDYVIRQNGRVDPSSISFSAKLVDLHFDLDQHVQRGNRQFPAKGNDIFLGRTKENPGSRVFVLGKNDAIGKPESFRRSGIYVWYSDEDNRWHMRWNFHNYSDVYKGKIRGSGIANVQRDEFTQESAESTFDLILINRGSGSFSKHCGGSFAHDGTTSSATIVDLDNDSWLDIVGITHGEQGSGNGKLFFLRNLQGQDFESKELARREQDLLHRADLIAHGFFNEDDKVDLAMTHGYGQVPGTNGYPRLLQNDTPTDYPALLVNLIGRNSNAFGIGAKLTLSNNEGETIGYRVQGLNANIAQSTHVVHFGLGKHTPPYQLKVDWPDGTTSQHTLRKAGHTNINQPIIN